MNSAACKICVKNWMNFAGKVSRSEDHEIPVEGGTIAVRVLVPPQGARGVVSGMPGRSSGPVDRLHPGSPASPVPTRSGSRRAGLVGDGGH